MGPTAIISLPADRRLEQFAGFPEAFALTDEAIRPPFAKWPRNDREAWVQATRANDPLHRPITDTWRPETVQQAVKAISHFATWSASRSAAGLGESIADRCTHSDVMAYVEEGLGRMQPTSLRTHLGALHRGLAIICPVKDWGFIAKILVNFPAGRIKHSKYLRLRSPIELRDLGLHLMKQAEDAEQRPAVRAVHYRNGLIIAILALRPLRRRNIAGLIIGRHLLHSGVGWWLSVPGAETKTGYPVNCPWPDTLLGPLERYLAQWRPVLVDRARDATDANAGYLWLTNSGQRLQAHTLGLEVSQITRNSFGKAVNVHLFRSCLATDIAINDPRNMHIASILLGHRQLATTVQHYNIAKSADASIDYHKVLRKLR